MTASGVYQMIERRGREVGVEVNPHKFRHTFSHNWLDNRGAEGDLMELNGWSSPQMLARYGRSARSARARRHYDDVMGGRRASVSMDGEVLAGRLEPRALQFVREWAKLRQDEILANWERARRNEPLHGIEPLS